MKTNIWNIYTVSIKERCCSVMNYMVPWLTLTWLHYFVYHIQNCYKCQITHSPEKDTYYILLILFKCLHWPVSQGDGGASMSQSVSWGSVIFFTSQWKITINLTNSFPLNTHFITITMCHTYLNLKIWGKMFSMHGIFIYLITAYVNNLKDVGSKC